MKKILSYPKIARDWLLINNQPLTDFQQNNEHRPILFFVFCLAGYCLFLLAMQPGWVPGGEIWAEAGTNYFPNASSPSMAVRFFSTDAGYIPLPQRVLAYIGHVFHLPARSIPYFYKWSAIIITGGMIGAFCLKPFRALVKSDFLRLLTTIAVLMVADFEVRQFINFTYFSTFFIGIVAALVFVEKHSDAPWWAWFIPILMISKPAVLSALPAMILAATVSTTRFKFITLAAALAGVAQIVQMAIIYPTSFFVFHKYNEVQKVIASIEYFHGFLGMFFLGKAVPDESLRPLWFILLGVGLLLFCIYTILKRRTNASALILIGLSLLYFNLLLNSFAASAAFNIENMKLMVDARLTRHIIAVYFGEVLVIVGLIASFAEARTFRHPWHMGIGPAIFLLWFFFSGWFAFAATLNKEPDFPVINNSQWQAMSDVIDSGQPVCVPVDPLGMFFERNCRQLDSQTGELYRTKAYTFEDVQVADGKSEITIEPPPSTLNSNLTSLAILVQPLTTQSIMVNTQAILKLKDGTVKYLIGFRQLPASGGLIMLTGTEITSVNEIQTVNFKFSIPVKLGYSDVGKEDQHLPVVLWMGN